MTRFRPTLLVLCFLVPAPIALAQSHHYSSGTHSSGTHSFKAQKSKKAKEPKTSGGSVHVNGYARKDGTHVSAYDRSAPSSNGTGTSATTSIQPPGFRADPSVQRDKHGKIKRSGAAKDAFKRENPCPSTGKSSGSCPGYVIDHKNPLECGGADAPSNMQWQTVADGKAKDKTERSCRQ